MRQRHRKLLGSVILLIFLAVYAIIAAGVGVQMLPRLSRVGEFIYYLAAGLLWTLPAGWLIRWMQRPDPPAEDVT
jgi:hypothetical protein